MLAEKNVTVILVNYSSAGETLRCLAALERLVSPALRTIVVENASPDDSLQQILEGWGTFASPLLLRQGDKSLSCPSGFPALRPAEAGRHIVLACTANRGFAAGNNVAITLALQDQSCRAVWLLNNDTEPDPLALEALCLRLKQQPWVGIAGSTLIYAHDRKTVQTLAGESYCPLLGRTNYIGGGSPASGLACYPQARVEKKLASITAASMLIRREVLKRVGLLDENFFLYVEEIEYCTRVRRAGFSLAWAPDSLVYHKEGSSTGAHWGKSHERPAWIDYLLLRNRIYMVRKLYPWAIPAVLLSYLGVMANRIRRGQIRRIRLVCRSVRDGLCGRMGPPGSRDG